MDTSCIILTCLLLIQMAVILVMLNPIYDIRKITKYLNTTSKHYRSSCFLTIAIYFVFVVYLGMYIPLVNIHKLIFSKVLSEYEKLILLNRVEKNYIIAGFSLFLVVVLYGVKALISYTASLIDLLDRKESEPLAIHSQSKEGDFVLPESIIPNLLRMKRSVSYETIIFTNELRDQLKALIKSVDFPHNRCTLSSILETTNGATLNCNRS